jgi:hypothetical protein
MRPDTSNGICSKPKYVAAITFGNRLDVIDKTRWASGFLAYSALSVLGPLLRQNGFHQANRELR